MAEWWQLLPGASGAKPDTPGDWLNFGLKQIPKFSTPTDMLKSSAEIAAKSNPAVAAFKDALPETTYNALLEAAVTNPSSAAGIVVSLGATGALGLLSSNNKPAPTETDPQAADRQQTYGSDQQTFTRLYGNETVLNEGYVGATRVRLGPLEFEVPPATSSTLPVHGGSGFTAPGAAPGISVKHVQNISTMVIPGSVPLYQSLGIQGQMIEFVGAFLGFDPKVLHDAHKHFVGPSVYEAEREATKAELRALNEGNPSLTPGESQVYSNYSPDPFYLPTDPQAKQIAERGYLGSAYGLSKGSTYDMGNVGSWAVSRAFEMQIRRGQPLQLVIDTGVVTIVYEIVVAGFDRLYQRDDRTWYKIQGLIVGAAEWRHKKKKDEAQAKRPKDAAAGAAGSGKAKAKRNRGNAKGKKGKGAGKTAKGGTTTRPVAKDPVWLAQARTKVIDLETKYKNKMAKLYKTLQPYTQGTPMPMQVYSQGIFLYKRASTDFRDAVEELSREAATRNMSADFLPTSLMAKYAFESEGVRSLTVLKGAYFHSGIGPERKIKPTGVESPTEVSWFTDKTSSTAAAPSSQPLPYKPNRNEPRPTA